MKIVQHPEYSSKLTDWEKFRLTLESGTSFVNKYLLQYPERENAADFRFRLAMTYVPAFAKAALIEIKNAIFQRIVDVSRLGGSDNYQNAISGKDQGVDRRGSSMNHFIGAEIILELLALGKVGVFVDNKPEIGPTLLNPARPYIYSYKAEDIISWRYDGPVLTKLLLRDNGYKYDPETNLPIEVVQSYRLCELVLIPPGRMSVRVSFFNAEGNETEQPILLNIAKIPFVMFALSDSLLTDVADYQISLMNLASSDITYAVKGNYPLYTEQYDPRSEASHLIGSSDGTSTDANSSKAKEVVLGAMKGRRYPLETERPGFVHPSPEPLTASMAKEEQIKTEIRLLVALAVSNLTSRRAGAESKAFDERGLEAGLSYIGLELENGEREISELWQSYEGKYNPITINYPEKFSLLSEDDRRKNAKELADLLFKAPSQTYKREVAKKIAKTLVGNSVSVETLKKIDQEIDSAAVIDIDPKNIRSDVEIGLVTTATASIARGYPEGEAEKAKQEHAERVARIAEAQMKATGVKDETELDGGKTNKMADKAMKDMDDDTSEPVRGEGKDNETED